MSAPSDDPILWASDTNWSSGPRSGDPLKDTSMSPGVAAQGIVAGQTLKADQLNQALHNHSQWLAWLYDEQGLGELTGDASDGDVTIAGTTTLTRDMYYDNLTVAATGVLDTSSHRVFARTITIAAGGVIRNNGEDGLDGGTHTGGAGAGSPDTVRTIGLGGDGGDGGSSGAGNGVAGLGSVGLGAGGGGGSGGTAVTGAPGAGGSCSTGNTVNGSHRHGPDRSLQANRWLGGGGGGGGAGGNGGIIGGGGGGGGGGHVSIRTGVLNSAGTIEANGGDGGDGISAGAGGGGGGGGFVVVRARRLTAQGTIQALGGSGGAGVSSGNDGVPGTAGTVLVLQA